MNINYSNNINFTATRRDYTPNVKKLHSRNKIVYKNEKAYLAEIDYNNENDIETLKNLSEDWVKAIFIENIYLDAKRASNVEYCGDNRFFVITEQKNHFEDLDYKKILAICEINEYKDGEIYLDYIQSNPESVYNPYAKFKNVGTALLNSLKYYYNKIDLQSLPSRNVLSFYKKNKFKSIDEANFKYNLRWEREK